jgi:hypothetical protein
MSSPSSRSGYSLVWEPKTAISCVGYATVAVWIGVPYSCFHCRYHNTVARTVRKEHHSNWKACIGLMIQMTGDEDSNSLQTFWPAIAHTSHSMKQCRMFWLGRSWLWDRDRQLCLGFPLSWTKLWDGSHVALLTKTKIKPTAVKDTKLFLQFYAFRH